MWGVQVGMGSGGGGGSGEWQALAILGPDCMSA